LGSELVRSVPDAAVLVGRGFRERPGGTADVPSGRLPIALLDDAWPTSAEVPAPSVEESALADELVLRTVGSLSCLVLGRSGGSVVAGQVSWLATGAGWIGLRPRVDGSPRRLIDVVPVQPHDLGSWVAPTVAALLEASR
jgi:hypothetical protein